MKKTLIPLLLITLTGCVARVQTDAQGRVVPDAPIQVGWSDSGKSKIIGVSPDGTETPIEGDLSVDAETVGQGFQAASAMPGLPGIIAGLIGSGILASGKRKRS